MNHTLRAQGTRRARLFREVTRAIGRRPHQRVCPLPLACAAIAIPFLAAWATASPGPAQSDGTPDAGRFADSVAVQAATPDPWAILDRARRQPADPATNAYVDLYGPLEPWEERLIARQGYVSVGR